VCGIVLAFRSDCILSHQFETLTTFSRCLIKAAKDEKEFLGFIKLLIFVWRRLPAPGMYG